ncbi:helix-turn-helix domain-containing protein [Xenorhabdus bovienii]|uniref:Putative counterpart of the neighbouring HipA-like protein n=1 Tax=Xenorhabdus bovienii str. feltiae Moldova TaxID=1398200 RepID=A0A077NT12_XENBV|nr:helix-turn-helix transcriptional regulator [Xenorhabdus bovienii]CDH02035.1 putative counterpart of the neighbouring HipA-like protein [Xenorhabdus bovienii str. feltiae Moldova]
MLSLYTAYDVQHELRDFIKRQRKQQKITVEVLSKRSGVPYSTIRKFERTGNISLRQFLMLLEAIGELNPLHQLTKERKQEPITIAEVLKNA